MDNLLENIEEQKELLKDLSLKTKKNKVFYNETIEMIEEKYKKILFNVLNEMYKRKEKLNILKDDEFEQRVNKVKEQIKHLHEDIYILNPSNSEIEKFNFDSSFYILKNFSSFSYDYIMHIFDKTITTFEKASIILDSNEFYYNYYVTNFMKEFLKVRKTESKDFNTLMSLFEKYYWYNPDLIYHIGLNFRSIATKYKKKLIKYQKIVQENIKKTYNINSFDDCKEKLNETYLLYNRLSEEQIYNVIESARNGEIDIKNYFKDSKTKKELENEFTINPFKDEFEEDKFYSDLKLLKAELKEYATYLHLKPIIDVFKEDYQKYIVEGKNNSNITTLKKIKDNISKIEHKIYSLNKQYNKKGIFNKYNDKAKINIINQTIDYCNQLKGIYDDLSLNYYIYQIKKILQNPVLINDMLYSYYSFDYYKKIQVNRGYGRMFQYDDLNDKCAKFDYYALDPTHHLIASLPIFRDSEIGKILVTKHRLNNIAITLEDVGENTIRETINKVNLLLRTKIIENNDISAEEIHFVLTAEKILENEGYSEMIKAPTEINLDNKKSHEVI